MSYEFEDDEEVLVRFPLTTEQRDGDRDGWPWLAGWVIRECGDDEWQIVVGDERVTRQQDGETIFPVCFRSSDELRIGS